LGKTILVVDHPGWKDRILDAIRAQQKEGIFVAAWDVESLFTERNRYMILRQIAGAIVDWYQIEPYSVLQRLILVLYDLRVPVVLYSDDFEASTPVVLSSYIKDDVWKDMPYILASIDRPAVIPPGRRALKV
jgi:hypothetical protein